VDDDGIATEQNFPILQFRFVVQRTINAVNFFIQIADDLASEL